MTDQLPLLPDETPAPVFALVQVDDIEPDEYLVGDPPSKAFVDTVRQFGLIHPVGLRYTLDGPLAVIYGRRRVKAARVVGLSQIPAMIWQCDVTLSDVLTLVENEQRKRNPLAALDTIERLAEQGATDEDICLAVGMPLGTLQAQKRLFRLIPPLRQAAREGKLLASGATEAARLPVEQQTQLVQVLEDEGQITVQAIRQVRRVRLEAAVQALPESLFATPGAEGFENPPAEPADPPRVESKLRRDLREVTEELEVWKALVNRQQGMLNTVYVVTGTGYYPRALENIQTLVEAAEVALDQLRQLHHKVPAEVITGLSRALVPFGVKVDTEASDGRRIT